MTSSNQGAILRDFLFGITILTVSLALLFVTAESVARLTGAGTGYGYPDGLFREDPDTGYSMVPNFERTPFVKHEFNITVWTNSAGFFDRERVLDRPGAVRLLSLGDSYVWGAYGVGQGQNFNTQLQTKLNNLTGKTLYEVIKAGVPGWGTDNELGFYRSRGFLYGAQIVLLSFTVANDFFDNQLTGELTARDGKLVRTESLGASRGLLGQVRNFVFAYSHFYRWAEYRFVQRAHLAKWMRQFGFRHGGFFRGGDSGLRELFALDTEAGRQSDLAVETRGQLLELNKVVLSHGARLVVFLIPAKFQVVASDIAAAKERFEVDHESLLAPQRYLHDLCAELEIPLIDGTEAIWRADSVEPHFWRLNPHFNHAGNELVSEIIAKGLVDLEVLGAATHSKN